MQIVSTGNNLHEMKKPVLERIRKNILKCRLLTFYPEYKVLKLTEWPNIVMIYAISTSVPRRIRFAELRKKINRTTFHKRICNLTPDVKYILKILLKKRRAEISPLFHNFCYLLLGFHVYMFKHGSDLHFERSGYSR